MTLAQVWRRLLRGSSPSLFMALLLAPAIGVNAAALRLAGGVMFGTPPGVEEPGRIVQISGFGTYAEVALVQPALRTVDLAGYTTGSMHYGAPPDVRPINVECVTANYMAVLGAHPVMGQWFGTQDQMVTADAVAVVSYSFWQRSLGQQPDVLGKTLLLRRRPYTVVGIAPPHFVGLGWRAIDVWVPLRPDRDDCSDLGATAQDGFVVSAFGRLRDGQTAAGSLAELAALTKHSGHRTKLGVRDLSTSRARAHAGDLPVITWMLGGGLLAFLLACINGATTMTMAAMSRRRELAVRAALGAPPVRLMFELLSDTLATALLCLAGGWLTYRLAVSALDAFFPLHVAQGYDADAFVVVLIVVLTTVSCGVSAIAAVVRVSRTDLFGVLKANDERISPGGASKRVLVALQVAVAFALLVAAGLFARSVSNLRHTVGYDIDSMIAVSIDPLHLAFDDDEPVQPLRSDLFRRFKDNPAIGRAAMASYAPFDSSPHTHILARAELGSRPVATMVNAISAGYFHALDVPVLHGREFLDTDAPGSAPVALVSRNLSLHLWQEVQAVGRCLYLKRNTDCVRVVGVVASNSARQLESPSLEVYVPLAQHAVHALPYAGRTIVVRATSPRRSASAIRAISRSSLPSVPVQVDRVSDLADPHTRAWRLGVTVFGLVGVLTFVLALTGVYYSLSLVIRASSGETGIRLALGAGRWTITRMFLLRGLNWIAVGWAVGCLIAWILVGSLRGMLFGVASVDLVIFAGATFSVFLSGLVACALPAVRAAQCDPLTAIRQD